MFHLPQAGAQSNELPTEEVVKGPWFTVYPGVEKRQWPVGEGNEYEQRCKVCKKITEWGGTMTRGHGSWAAGGGACDCG